jgi:hypothetical protein
MSRAVELAVWGPLEHLVRTSKSPYMPIFSQIEQWWTTCPSWLCDPKQGHGSLMGSLGRDGLTTDCLRIYILYPLSFSLRCAVVVVEDRRKTPRLPPSAAHGTGYGTGRDDFFPIPNLRDGMRDGTGWMCNGTGWSAIPSGCPDFTEVHTYVCIVHTCLSLHTSFSFSYITLTFCCWDAAAWDENILYIYMLRNNYFPQIKYEKGFRNEFNLLLQLFLQHTKHYTVLRILRDIPNGTGRDGMGFCDPEPGRDGASSRPECNGTGRDELYPVPSRVQSLEKGNVLV